MRFISRDERANGETDFKGETSTLTTDERVEFLNEYAKKLPEMFDDFSLDEPIVTLEAAKERMNAIKPQPLPEKRSRITFDNWKWIGYSENKRQNCGMKIPTQNFRCFIEWELAENVSYSCCSFSMGDAAKMEFDTDGQPYYISDREKRYISVTEGIEKIKFELDFVYRKWNIYLNDKLVADFVPFSNPDTSEVCSFSSPYDKSIIKHIRGVGYHRLTENDFEPFSINTFIDEDFKKPIDINGWNLYTGWFAARMHLDLLPPIYIDDVFAWTESIIRVDVNTQMGLASKKAVPHNVTAKIMPWFQSDGEVCATAKWQTPAIPNITETTEGTLEIENPLLWTADEPQLYKIVVELTDTDGNIVDDFVITTGIRTVSQRGGIFRINGKPELLRAPLEFGSRPPLDKIAMWDKCPPAEFYVQEMLMVKGMNGNGLRMSVHDERIGVINDPRICEIADQLGIMLVWQTNAWLRITSATNISLDKLATDIKQVRNHASIVIWQPSNHPSWKNWCASEKFHGALIDHEGSENTRVFKEAAEAGRIISEHPEIKGSYSKAEVAVIYDYENSWAIDELCGLKKYRGYKDTCIKHYGVFRKYGINVDIIGQTDDLSQYKVICAPMLCFGCIQIGLLRRRACRNAPCLRQWNGVLHSRKNRSGLSEGFIYINSYGKQYKTACRV